MRYFLELAYNGARFHGWQRQPNAMSVQESLEKALSLLLRKETALTGAGRTDTGVHARQMFAHFDVDNNIDNKEKFLCSLNNMAGRDIRVNDVIPMKEDAHARFDATERTYKYFFSYLSDPFLKELFWHSSRPLDIEKMNEAALLLLSTQDFTSFAKLHSDAVTNICDVRKAEIVTLKEDKEAMEFLGSLNDGFVFTITADRFLRNMVRAVMGTLVEVGRGKISVEEFQEIIEKKDRCEAGTSMPSQALFLWQIKYPYI